MNDEMAEKRERVRAVVALKAEDVETEGSSWLDVGLTNVDVTLDVDDLTDAIVEALR